MYIQKMTGEELAMALNEDKNVWAVIMVNKNEPQSSFIHGFYDCKHWDLEEKFGDRTNSEYDVRIQSFKATHKVVFR